MNDYSKFHQSPVNLKIHIFAVPLFILSALNLVFLLVRFDVWAAAAGVAGIVLSLVLQGIGHAREPNPPEPFAGPVDFVKRIFTEQFFKFPKFVLTGRWRANLKRSN